MNTVLAHPAPANPPHVLPALLQKKAMVTVLGIVVVLPIIEKGFAFVLVLAPTTFTPQGLFGLVGLNTYIVVVIPNIFPNGTLIEGFAPHAPLYLHQKMAVLWPVPPGE